MKCLTKTDDHYHTVIEEIKDAITECRKNVYLSLLELKWSVGEIILRYKFEGNLVKIAKDIDMTVQEVGRCVRFAEQWPGETFQKATDKKELPEGDNTSWRKMVNVYLPQSTRKVPECKHDGGIIKICVLCRKKIQ